MPTKGDHHRINMSDVQALLIDILSEHGKRVRLTFALTAGAGGESRTAIAAATHSRDGRRITAIGHSQAYWPTKARTSYEATCVKLCYEQLERIADYERQCEEQSYLSARSGPSPLESYIAGIPVSEAS